MKCLNCGEYVTSSQFFCSSCGKINVVCSNCGDLVSGDDQYCGNCGIELSHTIEIAKKRFEEKEQYGKEQREKELLEEKLKKLEPEIKQYAFNLIIECEGNKFKAIKIIKEKYNIDNIKASEYITEAYNKINENQVTRDESVNSSSIEDIIRKNNFEAVASIKEVRNTYGYDLVTAKEKVNAIIKQLKSTNEYIDPKGIKKTIIVSHNSRKKATSAISRGIVGNVLLGPVGLLAATSAKSNDTTTFQVIYNNGKQTTVTVKNGSFIFREYCKYLDN